jgi:hypothetical protein
LLASRFLKGRQASTLSRPFAFADTSVADFPGLDASSVNDCTAQLESFGFVAGGDYSAVTVGDLSSQKQFLRVLAGPRHKSWARVTQATTGSLGVTKVECCLVSSLGEGYAVYTSNAEPWAAMYAGRLAREIRLYAPGASLPDLLESHLATRDRVARESGLTPLAVESCDAYLTHELDRAAERRRVIGRKNAWLFLLRIDWFNRSQIMEWSGDDKRITRRRRGPRPPMKPDAQRA